MKNFIQKISIKIILPILMLFLIAFFWDPFKVFFTNNYNSQNQGANREFYCLTLLTKNNDTISNFIIGNSRSLAFRTDYWSNKIQVNPKTCFHYDGSGAGLYRTVNAINYLNKNYRIKNILIVFDVEMFQEVKNPTNIFGIQPPSVSNDSRIIFYYTFLKASINPVYVFAKFVNSVTNKYYDWMGYYIPANKEKSIYNCKTADLNIWSYDKLIQKDSILYYKSIPKMYELSIRAKAKKMSELTIKDEQFRLLEKLKIIVEKNNINLKIVISPLYNQIAINDNDKLILTKLFGINNVYDFSGINKFTNKITNFYESSHYKPCVANQIMDSIYSTSSK